jgi:hypothetical protein
MPRPSIVWSDAAALALCLSTRVRCLPSLRFGVVGGPRGERAAHAGVGW